MIQKIFRDHYTTIAIIIATVIAAILSFAGYLTQSQAVSFTLIAVGGLAVSMLFTSLTSEKNICNAVNRMKQTSSRKVTRKEHYRLLNTTINNAQSHIWIMTIDAALSSKAISTIPEREQYYNTLKQIVKSNRNIQLRRIYGLPTEQNAREDKIKWVQSDLNELKTCSNFQARMFDWRKFNGTISPLSLQIVDNIFCGIVNPHFSTGLDGSGEDICIEDINVVQYLSRYYNEVWDLCEELKIGNDIKFEKLK